MALSSLTHVFGAASDALKGTRPVQQDLSGTPLFKQRVMQVAGKDSIKDEVVTFKTDLELHAKGGRRERSVEIKPAGETEYVPLQGVIMLDTEAPNLPLGKIHLKKDDILQTIDSAGITQLRERGGDKQYTIYPDGSGVKWDWPASGGKAMVPTHDVTVLERDGKLEIRAKGGGAQLDVIDLPLGMRHYITPDLRGKTWPNAREMRGDQEAPASDATAAAPVADASRLQTRDFRSILEKMQGAGAAPPATSAPTPAEVGAAPSTVPPAASESADAVPPSGAPPQAHDAARTDSHGGPASGPPTANETEVDPTAASRSASTAPPTGAVAHVQTPGAAAPPPAAATVAGAETPPAAASSPAAVAHDGTPLGPTTRDLMDRAVASPAGASTAFAVLPEDRPLTQADLREHPPQPMLAAAEPQPNYVPDLKKSKLIETPSLKKNLSELMRSIRLNENVMLIGETGVAKTAMVTYMAALMGKELRRINLSDRTDITELIGGYKPSARGGYEWVDGIVTEALRKGQWIVFDEMNLAPSGLLEALNSLFDSNRSLTITTNKGVEVVKAHPETRIFATINPVTYGGRKELSDALLSRFSLNYVHAPTEDELVMILEGVSEGKIDRTTARQMAKVHMALAKLAKERGIGKREVEYHYTVRDLLKWTERVLKLAGNRPERMSQAIAEEISDVYMGRLRDPADRVTAQSVIRINLGDPGRAVPERVEHLQDGRVKVGDNVLSINPRGGSLVPDAEADMVGVPSTMRMLDSVFRCVQLDEPMLLVGPTAAGKTSLIQYAARLTNNNCHRFNLKNQTDITEFIGGWVPKAGGKPGEYVWQDGILVEAMRRGDWVIFDEINLAPPALLERINSLLDKERCITLTEKDNKPVYAHPNFRIFATMNPPVWKGRVYQGRKELSHALRNRFTETWVDNITERGELLTIVQHWLNKIGTDKNVASEKMIDFHEKLVDKIEKREIATTERSGKFFDIRHLKSWSKFMCEFHAEEGLGNAFYNGVAHVYANRFPNQKDRNDVLDVANDNLPAALSQQAA